MDYQYVAYTNDKRLVKGKLSATSEEAAINLLSYGGYQAVSLKPVTPFINPLSSICTGKSLVFRRTRGQKQE